MGEAGGGHDAIYWGEGLSSLPEHCAMAALTVVPQASGLPPPCPEPPFQDGPAAQSPHAYLQA